MISPFPPIEPFHTEMLDVGNNHFVYFEQVGNSNGQPALYLHGGPGPCVSTSC